MEKLKKKTLPDTEVIIPCSKNIKNLLKEYSNFLNRDTSEILEHYLIQAVLYDKEFYDHLLNKKDNIKIMEFVNSAINISESKLENAKPKD